MPVTTVVEAWAFGGAPAGSEVHPRVVDVLLPPGVDQAAVLGSFNAAVRTLARVPFVYADGSDPFQALAGPEAPAATPAAAWTVADVSGDLVTIAGPTAGISPLQIGDVLGPDGTPVARVVVARVVEGGVAASVIEGRERIAAGAPVRFETPRP
jgi:hypothetical protein